MDKNELALHIAIAEKAVIAAGDFLANYSQQIAVASQKGKDIKLYVDSESENRIIDILREKSDFPILAEEIGLTGSADKAAQYKWIVDPLDGSLNYLRGIPCSCVSIGLWDSVSPILGAVYDFNRKELFTGVAGQSSWLNGKQIRVSNVDRADNAVLFTGFPVSMDFTSASLHNYVQQVIAFKKVRLLGSAALSLAYVAAGRGEAYFERHIMHWDIAAGISILSGAGGHFSLKKTEMLNAFDVVATNGLLPDNILAT